MLVKNFQATQYTGDEYLGGKFGDWFKRAVSGVAKVTGALTDITSPKEVAPPPPPPAPGIKPVYLIAGGGALIVVVMLLSRRR